MALLEQMLAVEEYNRIKIEDVCAVLSQSKFGDMASQRESSVHSLAEEYRDYYGDFENEVVKNFENQQNFQKTQGFSPSSNHASFQYPQNNQTMPFQEISQQEVNKKFSMRKRGHNMQVNSFNQRLNSPPPNFHEKKNVNLDLRGFDFKKQSSPQIPHSDRYEPPVDHRVSEYGYYHQQPNKNNNQNLPPPNYNYEEPKRISKKHNSSSSNLLSAGFKKRKSVHQGSSPNSQEVKIFPFNFL